MRRDLGEGRWDRILKRRMVNLSVADNYDDAKEEWMATGSVWWRGNGEMPDWVINSSNGAGKCLCGHEVVYHFEIHNTETGRRECVGSDHINSYLIMRQIAQDLKIDISLITEEQVEKWVKARVTSMKAEAWWAENGESFELMFNKIKEIDIRYNSRKQHKDYYWDSEIHEYVLPRQIRKRAEGSFGSPNYKMASIVWRWNHSDNPKNQMTVHGYPNARLMQDLALYFVHSDSLIAKMEKEKQLRQEKILAVQEQKRLQEERRMIKNLTNIRQSILYEIKNRLEIPRKQVLNEATNRYNAEQRRIRLEREREIELIQLEQDKLTFEEETDEFVDMCRFYGLPIFTQEYANTTWESRFLLDIKKRFNARKEITHNQLDSLRSIFRQPSEKQIKYLRDLGWEDAIPTASFASRKIDELKNGKERSEP